MFNEYAVEYFLLDRTNKSNLSFIYCFKGFVSFYSFIFSFLLLFSVSSFAEEERECTESCPSDIQLSLKLGFGQAYSESPLNIHDDIKFNVLPAWSFYYKDWFYIENTSIGVNLITGDDYVVDLVGQLNRDGIYAYGGTLIPPFVFNPSLEPFIYPKENTRLSYLSGVKYMKFTDTNVFTLGAYYDITSVHDGHEVEMSWQKILFRKNLKLAVEVGAIYKSDELLEYYYGNPLTGDNINYYAEIDIAYPITNRLDFVLNYRHAKLSSKIISSEATIAEDVAHGFIGILWITNW